MILSGIGLAIAMRQQLRVRDAVVVVPEATVRYGPFEESEVALKAIDGAEFRVLDSRNNWFYVADRSGRTGWLPSHTLQIIRI